MDFIHTNNILLCVYVYNIYIYIYINIFFIYFLNRLSRNQYQSGMSYGESLAHHLRHSVGRNENTQGE